MISGWTSRALLALAGILYFASAIYLGTTTAEESSTLRVLCVLIVAVPGTYALASLITAHWGDLPDITARKVKRSLQHELVQISRSGNYPEDVTKLSFHVWILPPWFQRLTSYNAPKRVRRRGQVVLAKFKSPHMVKLAVFRFAHQNPSGVYFRQGAGLIGHCMSENEANKIHLLALDSTEYQEAIANDDGWEAASPAIKHGLQRKHARMLADSYGQVAALVLRDGYRAMGCITLELPPGAEVRLKETHATPAAQFLAECLSNAKGAVENHLTNAME